MRSSLLKWGESMATTTIEEGLFNWEFFTLEQKHISPVRFELHSRITARFMDLFDAAQMPNIERGRA